MTGAMQGSTHSLRQIIQTRTARQRRASAGRVTARRHSSHAGEIALIHSDFAHRFYLAMQEVCVTTRSAMIQRLTSDKAVALERVRLMRAADASDDRFRRNRSWSLQTRYGAASLQCYLCPLKPTRCRRRAFGKKRERVNDCD